MMLNKKPKVSYAANLASKMGKQVKSSRNRILSIMGQGRGSWGRCSIEFDFLHCSLIMALSREPCLGKECEGF